jgi:hypothetical protein
LRPVSSPKNVNAGSSVIRTLADAGLLTYTPLQHV